MDTIREYIDNNRDRFLEELFTLLRIPSVSSKSEHKDDMYSAANQVKKSLLDAGASKAEVYDTDGHPVIYAEKVINADLPTVLVYGHYDVQPPEPLDLWKSEPFEPEIRDDKIWGRGADDDKGQLFMHVKAFEFMTSSGNLPCNVKFMIEGEEEIGSPNLAVFCREKKEMLKADVILVSDTTMVSQDIPSITAGLRGLTFMEVEVTGPDHDLHSGLFGGAVVNPCNALTRMIASLTDDENRITIPGFYDDVIVISEQERSEMAKRPFDQDEFMDSIGVDKLDGEQGFTTHERLGIRPTLDINGIWGGYTGEGAKTILPSKAYAKISMRLVPDQDSKKIAKLFEDHFRSIAPEGVSVKVSYLHGGQPYVSPVDIVEYQAAAKALGKVFGKSPIPVRSGGSIPIISTFEDVLGIKSILLGFGLDTDAIHSPNENYPLFNFFKGIETIPWFYRFYSEMKK